MACAKVNPRDVIWSSIEPPYAENIHVTCYIFYSEMKILSIMQQSFCKHTLYSLGQDGDSQTNVLCFHFCTSSAMETLGFVLSSALLLCQMQAVYIIKYVWRKIIDVQVEKL